MHIRGRYTSIGGNFEDGLRMADDVEPRTKQAFKEECDINNIMRKYLEGAPIPANVSVGRYGDFSSGADYLEAQSILLTAREQFAALPAKVRERFGNNPAQLLEFVADPKNLDEARKLGLLKLEEPKAPPVVVASPEPTK
ncbi:MAG: internal scaffolding protein [Microviridae sp.]|nr:MAG: internal scaffolding protein [Microviridae sp.]